MIRALLAVAGAGWALVLAPPALGATVEIAGGWIVFTAAPGEANAVSFALAGDPEGEDPAFVDVTDAGARIEAGEGCSAQAENTVRCPHHVVRAHLGDGADSLSCLDADACPGLHALGGDGADTITGTGFLRAYGEAGDDTLVGSGWLVEAFGGEGEDTITVTGGVQWESARLSADGGPGDDTIGAAATWAAPVTLAGGPGDDSVGGTGPVVAHGEWGADRLSAATSFGGPGADTLVGSAEEDCFAGGRGDDRLDGGRASDRLFGGSGNDVVNGGAGSDDLTGGRGADRIRGGVGRHDTAYYRHNARPVSVTLDARPNDGSRNERDNVRGDVEAIVGSPRADLLVGNARNNVLFGDDGDDVLLGQGGNDFLAGEGGADRLAGGPGNDILRGASFSFRDDVLPDGSRRDTLRGGSGQDRLVSQDLGPDNLVDGGSGYDRAVVDRWVDPLSAVERVFIEPWVVPWRDREPDDPPYPWRCGAD